jgi:hypothetical protein
MKAGDRFGMLKLVRIIGKDKYYSKIWECKCDCGGKSSPTEANLKRGLSMSCCRSKKGMLTHGECYTPFYKRYFGIVDRCKNKNNPEYQNYGGRGIKNLWKSYEEFRDYMQPSFLEHCKKHGVKNTSIERIDNDGNYSKNNCRWATRKEQRANQRFGEYLEYNGMVKNIKQWAEYAGVPYGTFLARIKKWKWPLERAINKSKNL